MLTPYSPRLGFTRDGQVLISVDDDAVTLVDTRTAGSTRIAVDHAIAAVGFSDQVWIAAGARPVLTRHALDGRLLGVPIALELPADALVGAPVGTPAALWTSAPARVVHENCVTEQAAEIALPLTGRRFVTASGGRVLAPSGLACQLGAGARVVGGAVVFDGTAALVVAERPSGRELAVIGLANGRVLLRQHAIACDLRVAARRGLLAMRVEPDRIAMLDLRSGRIHGELACPPGIVDFALDPDGHRIALRNGCVELVALANALRTRATTQPEPEAQEAIDTPEAAQTIDAPQAIDTLGPAPHPAPRATPVSVPVQPEPEPTPAMPRTPTRELLQATGPLLALAPRRELVPLPRAEAIVRLERERERVLARALAGIATGWDTRRLGYANESKHPFELEVAALLGASRGHAEDHVASARERLAAAEAACTVDREDRFAESPLGELAHDFGLSPLDIEILVTIAAPTLWGETARLYAVLANDPGRGVVDEMLVAQLLGHGASRYDIAAALAPDATLSRHDLVHVIGDRQRPFTHLAIDPIVAARLRGEPLPVPEAIATCEATCALDDLYAPIAALQRVFGELARPQRAVRLAVRGRRGSGRRSILAAIAARAGRKLGVIDVAQLAAGDGAALRSLLRSASLCGLVPCLVGSLGGEYQARALGEAVAAHPGPVVAALGVDEACLFAPGHLELALPNLSASERLDHWRRAIARHGLRIADVEATSNRYRLTPGMIERAAAHVAQTATREPDHAQPLEVAIRQHRDERLARIATRVTRLPQWSDVVLPPDVLDSLRELVGRVRHGRRVYEDWGFDAVMTTGRGLTALFDGRPGTGKTMVAGIVARELGLDLYRVDVSRLVSKWIGETEKNLSEIFDAVDDGQAIILFDEADSLFAKRTEVKSSNDRYANLEVNYLLQRIDSFDGIAILTTNFGSAIDPAFRRRVSFKLSFPFPDEEAREQLWRVHLPRQLPVAGELDLTALARRFQLAGGYIRNACLRAAFLAAQEETTLAQRHLERAVQLEYQQVGKISTSGPVE